MPDAPETCPCCGQPIRERKRRGYPARTTPERFDVELKAAAREVAEEGGALTVAAVAERMGSTAPAVHMRLRRFGMNWKEIRREILSASQGDEP